MSDDVKQRDPKFYKINDDIMKIIYPAIVFLQKQFDERRRKEDWTGKTEIYLQS